MTLELSISDLVDATDLDLGSSPWFSITQERVGQFADATDDHQWIHVDSEAAAEGPFGGTIAHGYLTLSLVPAMLRQLFVVKGANRGTNYGLEKVRFTSPVPVGAEIRLTARIPEAEVRQGAVRYRVVLSVEIKGETRPAMIGEAIFLRYPDDARQLTPASNEPAMSSEGPKT